MLLWKKDKASVHLWSPDPWMDRLPFYPLYTARIGSFSTRGSVCPLSLAIWYLLQACWRG